MEITKDRILDQLEIEKLQREEAERDVISLQLDLMCNIAVDQAEKSNQKLLLERMNKQNSMKMGSHAQGNQQDGFSRLTKGVSLNFQ